MTTRATISERSRFRVRFPGAFTSAAKDADELGQGAEPWSWLAPRTHGDAVVPRPRALRASGRRPRLFSRCLIASEHHACGARAPSALPPKSPLGRRTHGCGRVQ